LLSNAIVLTSQGIPFIHAGEEFLRTKFGNENSFKSPDNINKLAWERKNKYKAIFEYYKGLIQLRKTHPAFSMSRSEDIRKHLEFINMPKENMIGYIISDYANGDSWKEIIVLFNANREEVEIKLPGISWSVVVDDKKAGIEELYQVNDGKVNVSALGTLVLFST